MNRIDIALFELKNSSETVSVKALVGFTLLCTCCVMAWSDTTEITLAADEWCPYNCEPGTELPGYVVELATVIFAKHNISVNYLNVPWTRALRLTRSARYDGVIGAIPSEAPDFIFPEAPVGVVAHTFYTRFATKWSYEDITSLASIKLGSIQDYSYGEKVTNYMAQNKDDKNLVFVGGENALLSLARMLDARRIDALIEDRTVFQYFLNTTEYRLNLKPSGLAEADPIYIAFSPNAESSTEYAAWLSDGISELRASGDLDKILAKYGLNDWQPLLQ